MGNSNSLLSPEQPFILTRENYHSLEANKIFMSRGQFIDFTTKCEAATVAKLRGEWVEEQSTALLVGSYVHAWSENRQSEFIAEHPGMFKKDGGLKADYVQADEMINTLRNDPLVMYSLEGKKEVILTAEFAGATWKVMLDVYNPERRRIVDLKTTRNIREHVWNEEWKTKLSFIENYNYVLQAALYAEIERIANGRPEEDWFDFYIVAASKQDYPDKEVIDMREPDRYRAELANIEANMPRVLALKNGEVKPERCEVCDYCRSTKKLTRAIHYSEL